MIAYLRCAAAIYQLIALQILALMHDIYHMHQFAHEAIPFLAAGYYVVMGVLLAC